MTQGNGKYVRDIEVDGKKVRILADNGHEFIVRRWAPEVTDRCRCRLCGCEYIDGDAALPCRYGE